jgi:hypothetical protein
MAVLPLKGVVVPGFTSAAMGLSRDVMLAGPGAGAILGVLGSKPERMTEPRARSFIR